MYNKEKMEMKLFRYDWNPQTRFISLRPCPLDQCCCW